MKERRVVELPATVMPVQKETRRHGPLRVAAYCRVSTEVEAQQSSFQTQKEYYTAKIQANPDWVLAGIFADDGITGTSVEHRSNFKKMMQNCRRRKIDLILTKSISRFARNTVDCLLAVRELSQLGIPVIFETENINTATMESEFLLAIMGAMYQAESEATSSRIKWAIRARFREGKFHYPYKNWFGYREGEDGQPDIVPEEAIVIKQIFDMFLAGDSSATIAQELNRRGVATKNGKMGWSAARIQSILRNEKYAGNVLLQKTYAPSPLEPRRKNKGELPMYLVENAHPAIISKDTFQWVQEELQRRNRARNRSKSVQTEGKTVYSGKYALSEILVCGECKAKYRRVLWMPGGERRYVWRCGNRLEHGKRICHHSPTLNETEIHQALTEALNQQLHHPDYLLAPFTRIAPYHIAPAKTMPELYDNLCARQKNADEQFVDLVMEYAGKREKNVDPDAFAPFVADWRENEKAIEMLQLRLYDGERSQKNHWLPYRLTEYNDTMIRLLVDTIEVIDRSHLRIAFKSGFEIVHQIQI